MSAVFTVVAPGTVRHHDGWIVHDFARWTIRYEAGGRLAMMAVDRDASQVVLYPDTLVWVVGGSGRLSPAHAALVSERIELALAALSDRLVSRSAGWGRR